MRRTYAYLAAVLIVAVLAVVWYTHRTVETASPGAALPVGAIAPLSGDNAQFGTALKQGMELALREVNDHAAAEGLRPPQLHFEDSMGDPATAVSAFRKLVDFDHTPIVLGAMFSKETMAIAPIAESRHIVLLSPTSSDVALTKAGDYIFRIYPSDSYDGEFLANYIAQQPDLHRLGVLYLTTSSTTAVATIFKELVEKQGRQVVLIEAHDEGTRDFRSVLEKVRAAKPDAVMLFSYLNEMALILRQAKELGYHFRFIAISTIYDQKLFELAGDAANGVVFSTAIYEPTSTDPRIRDFVQRFRKIHGAAPNIWAAYGYDVVRVAAEAIWHSNGSPDSIKQALYAIHDFPGVTGITSFDSNGDVKKPLRMMAVRNGRFEPLGTLAGSQ